MIDLALDDDTTKVRQHLRMLGPAEHVRYPNFISPEELRARSFPDTIDTLTKSFG